MQAKIIRIHNRRRNSDSLNIDRAQVNVLSREVGRLLCEVRTLQAENASIRRDHVELLKQIKPAPWGFDPRDEVR